MTAPNLKTSYLGFELKNPLVVSSCPLTGDINSARQLEEFGAAAIVLPSLFQEQIEHEELELGRLHDFGAESFHEASGYFPQLQTYNHGPEGYLQLVEGTRGALTIPVLASLNGVSAEGWQRYAKQIESAGASGIELNLSYVATDINMSAGQVEALYVEQVEAVAQAVEIPVAVKIGAHLSAPANFAKKIHEAGASGLVIFNRFLEPDIELETMQVVPRLELSHPAEMRMALRWIAILSGKLPLSLASTGGVHGSRDAVKLLLAGADSVMVASGVLRGGMRFLRNCLQELQDWLVENEYESIEQMKGSMNHGHCPDPAGYERLNYMRALQLFTTQQS